MTFRGMARTRLPSRIRWGQSWRELTVPPGPLFVADFVNVVLDDDYGLRGMAPPPRTIADIGSNVGIFSSYARALFPSAVIHAYEPSPDSAELARRNAEHSLTTVFEEGVARAPGRARMREIGASNLAQTVPDASGDIPLVGFGEVVERLGGEIDLLKIDCEGAEWDFMRDPADFAGVGRIRMEYHLIEGRTLLDLEQLAARIGFRIAHLVPNQGFGIVWLDRVR